MVQDSESEIERMAAPRETTCVRTPELMYIRVHNAAARMAEKRAMLEKMYIGCAYGDTGFPKSASKKSRVKANRLATSWARNMDYIGR